MLDYIFEGKGGIVSGIMRRTSGAGPADDFCDCDHRNPHLCAHAVEHEGLCPCRCHPRARDGRPVLDLMEVLAARLGETP